VDGKKQFEEWAIIELFGHQKIAGRVSEQQIGGCSFVRVDVPKTQNVPAFSRLFGNGAIYSITVTDERSATMAAQMFTPEPMDRWTVDHHIKALTHTPTADGDGSLY
jgi:hypothetical protein